MAATKASETGQLRTELAEARREIAELRAALRAAAALTVGIGFTRAPQTTTGVRTVGDLCRVYGVNPQYATILDQLFG